MIAGTHLLCEYDYGSKEEKKACETLFTALYITADGHCHYVYVVLDGRVDPVFHG